MGKPIVLALTLFLAACASPLIVVQSVAVKVPAEAVAALAPMMTP